MHFLLFPSIQPQFNITDLIRIMFNIKMLSKFNKELTPNLENPMVKLYNIEKKEIKNNQIKINLEIDLYQMEEY